MIGITATSLNKTVKKSAELIWITDIADGITAYLKYIIRISELDTLEETDWNSRFSEIIRYEKEISHLVKEINKILRDNLRK
jgi:hypothetical protein